MFTVMKLVLKFVEMCIAVSKFEKDVLPGLDENANEWKGIIDKVKSWFE